MKIIIDLNTNQIEIDTNFNENVKSVEPIELIEKAVNWTYRKSDNQYIFTFGNVDYHYAIKDYSYGQAHELFVGDKDKMLKNVNS